MLKVDQNSHCFAAIVAHTDTLKADVSNDHEKKLNKDHKKYYFTDT